MGLIIVTHNAGKLAEFKHLLKKHVTSIESLSTVRCNITWTENGLSFAENARIKINAVSGSFPNQWLLADDSGLCVSALGDAPGIYSSSYGGTEGDSVKSIKRIISELKAQKLDSSNAYFICHLHLRSPDGLDFTTQGFVHGKVITHLSGEHGFGYDPIFIPAGESRTMAELSQKEKNTLSHRARAVAALLQILKGKACDLNR